MNYLINLHFSLLTLIILALGLSYPMKKFRPSEKLVIGIFKLNGIISLGFSLFGLISRVKPFDYNFFGFIQLHLNNTTILIYLVMSVLLASTAHFSFTYIHKEIGFYKFFINLGLFWMGLFLFNFGNDNIIIFAGWEFIGISSVFLISYYHYRKEPILSSLYVVSFYKFADIILITALLFLKHNHHEHLHDSFDQYLYLGLIVAGFIKSASFPFTPWLPKAMEGPTPSSAIYYAALSLNTGILLIYKFLPEILVYDSCRYFLIIGGILTVLYSSIQSRVQSDIKATLAYSTSVQIGLVLIELALGYPTLALIHLFSSSILKVFQFIRTPSLLHIYHSMEGEYGKPFGKSGVHFQYLLPKSVRRLIYYLAINHFYLDSLYVAMLEVVKKAGKLSELLLYPIVGNKTSVDYRSLLWGGYYIVIVTLISIGSIEVGKIYFSIIPVAILAISTGMLFEKKSNSFIGLFALYKILESLIIYSVHDNQMHKLFSIILSGMFATILIILCKRQSEGRNRNQFLATLAIIMMLLFTNFPFLLQSLLNEHIIEAFIGEGHYLSLVLYCLANTFMNLGLYNFVFNRVYLREAHRG